MKIYGVRFIVVEQLEDTINALFGLSVSESCGDGVQKLVEVDAAAVLHCVQFCDHLINSGILLLKAYE